jgi:enoyl-CoA hydratase/carnithine racemase
MARDPSEGSGSQQISGEMRGEILVITFDDPATRNSFSLRAANLLKACLADQVSSYRALVFLTKGPVFCSGGNLSDYASMSTSEEGKLVNQRITSILDDIAKLPVPTVCAVSGDCFGGGLELVSAFDSVICVPHAMFGLWQRKVGLSFGWGGGARLESRIGAAQLKRLSLSTECVGAHQALTYGLVDAVVPSVKLEKVAFDLAQKIASLPQAPIGGLKTWSSSSEAKLFEQLWWNEEHRAVLKKHSSR